MATDKEISDQIRILDDSFRQARFISDEAKMHRLISATEVLDEFPVETIARAKREFIRENTEEPPSISQVYRKCLETSEEDEHKAAKVKPPAAPVEEHQCGKGAKSSAALGWLRIVAPYEVDHTMCIGDIKATHPRCRFRPVPVNSIWPEDGGFPAVGGLDCKADKSSSELL